MLSDYEYHKKLNWIRMELKNLFRSNLFEIKYDTHWKTLTIICLALNFTYNFNFNPNFELLQDGAEDRLMAYIVNTIRTKLEPVLFTKPMEVEAYPNKWKEVKDNGY